MRLLIRITAGLAVAAVILAIVGLLVLPRQLEISRSVVIDAPAAAVWPHVSDLRRFNDWSPWSRIDPEGTTYRFEGPETGVGQTLHWSSDHPDVGSGSQEIVEIDPGRSVTSRLAFGEMGRAEASLIVTPASPGTEVTWQFQTDLGRNPVARWLGLMFDYWVGRDFETGLARLKRIAESDAARGTETGD